MRKLADITAEILGRLLLQQQAVGSGADVEMTRASGELIDEREVASRHHRTNGKEDSVNTASAAAAPRYQIGQDRSDAARQSRQEQPMKATNAAPAKKVREA